MRSRARFNRFIRKKVLLIQFRYRNFPEIASLFLRELLAAKQALRRAYNFFYVKVFYLLNLNLLKILCKFFIINLLFF